MAPPQAGHQSALIWGATTAWQWLQTRSMCQRYSIADTVGPREPGTGGGRTRGVAGLEIVPLSGTKTPQQTSGKNRPLIPELPLAPFQVGQNYGL